MEHPARCPSQLKKRSSGRRFRTTSRNRVPWTPPAPRARRRDVGLADVGVRSNTSSSVGAMSCRRRRRRLGAWATISRSDASHASFYSRAPICGARRHVYRTTRIPAHVADAARAPDAGTRPAGEPPRSRSSPTREKIATPSTAVSPCTAISCRARAGAPPSSSGKHRPRASSPAGGPRRVPLVQPGQQRGTRCLAEYVPRRFRPAPTVARRPPAPGVSVAASVFLSQPWNFEKSFASHASRRPGALRSQSGRTSRLASRGSCQKSTTDGGPGTNSRCRCWDDEAGLDTSVCGIIGSLSGSVSSGSRGPAGRWPGSEKRPLGPTEARNPRGCGCGSVAIVTTCVWATAMFGYCAASSRCCWCSLGHRRQRASVRIIGIVALPATLTFGGHACGMGQLVVRDVAPG